MTKTLRIGAVGTSSVMDVMQEAIRLTEGVTCNVIYSRSRERGTEYAKKNGIPDVCTDFEELIGRKDVDIIYIASPNSCHVTHGEKALTAGKHVIMEKPLALSRKEVDDLYGKAHENGCFLFEAITTLFMPNYLACRSLLPSLGPVRDAVIRYGQYSSKMDLYKKGIIASSLDPKMKGGALNDLGIYCIHAAIDMFGIPSAVTYTSETGPNGVDLEGELRLNYGSFTCRILTSKKRDIGSGCRIEGENGFFTQEGPVNAFGHCRAQIRDSCFEISLQGNGNRMIYELARFRDAVYAGDDAFHYRMYHQSRTASGVLEDSV